MHSLGKTLLAFGMLHFVLQGQTCLLLQVFIGFLLLHSNPYDEKDIFLCVSSRGLVGLHRTVQLLQHQCLEHAAAKLLQLCPTLCDPRDDSPPGSPIPGILQARTLEWVAISFSNA